MLVATTTKDKMLIIDIPFDKLSEYPSFGIVVNVEALKEDAQRRIENDPASQGESRSLLISCFQGGFGDRLLTAWLIPYTWRNSGYPNAIAVLAANTPSWMHRALAGLSVWEFTRHWKFDDPAEIEKYDRLISTAAHPVGVGHVETMGPTRIPTQGDWSRCDDELYTRLAKLAASGIYPECPFTPADDSEVDNWLAGRGLGGASRLAIVHARADNENPYKNPMQERTRDLTGLLLAKFPVEVLLLGKCQDIAVKDGNRYAICEEHLSPELLAGLFSKAACFIGSDSGLRHLAGIMGTYIITFKTLHDEAFGPFVPLDRFHRITVSQDQRGCGPFDFDPQQVVAEVSKVLAP